ncbi:twin transmembrane helix small protein [Vogesella amnigena]|uniref:Twin transmembrane helix small protein n=1 Tax=Vogesella amnigena TaxID=1507449 RepID=A0ABV7TXJ3_9NEIS
MNAIVPLLLLLIVGSLGYALRSLTRGGDSRRTARALTLRISLSLTLFAVLMLGKWLGSW